MKKRKVEFFKHNLDAKDKANCHKVLGSIFLTTGELVKEFESKFANYIGSRYCVGVTSCTDALFLSLKYFGVKEGDEVITTALTFVATTNVIEHVGAKPVLVDVDSVTANIDPNLIEKAITKKTKAIIVVHLYGQMCDMKKIRQIANKHNLYVIEDCAQSIEAKRDGYKVGKYADFACFSFYTVKTITCGEGGAITCNSKKAYDWLIKARLHGVSKSAADRYTKKYEHYDMQFPGYKCNMTNIDASLLINQLDRIDTFLAKREKIADKYDKAFANNDRVLTMNTIPNSVHARFVYTIWVDPNERDKYLSKIQDYGIGVAVHLRPVHLMSYYRKKYGYKRGDFPNSEMIGDSTISIPFYPKLRDEEIKYVIRSVSKIVNEKD